MEKEAQAFSDYTSLYYRMRDEGVPGLPPPPGTPEASETRAPGLEGDLALMTDLLRQTCPGLYGMETTTGMDVFGAEALLQQFQSVAKHGMQTDDDAEDMQQSANLSPWASGSHAFDLPKDPQLQDLSPNAGSPVAASASFLSGEPNSLNLDSFRGQEDLGVYGSSPYSSNPMMEPLAWRQKAPLNGPFQHFGSASGNLGSRMGQVPSPLVQRSASFNSTHMGHHSHSLSNDNVLQKVSNGSISLGAPSMPAGSPSVPIPNHVRPSHARTGSVPSIQKEVKLPLSSHSGRLLGPSKLRINSAVEQRPESPPCWDPRMEASAPPTPTHTTLSHPMPSNPHNRTSEAAMARALHSVPLPYQDSDSPGSVTASHSGSLSGGSPRLPLRSSEPTGLRSRLSLQTHAPGLAQDYLHGGHMDQHMEDSLEEEGTGDDDDSSVVTPAQLARAHSRGTHATTGPNSPAAVTPFGGGSPAFGRAPASSSDDSSADAAAAAAAAAAEMQRGSAATGGLPPQLSPLDMYLAANHGGPYTAMRGGARGGLSAGFPQGSLPLSSGMATSGSSYSSSGTTGLAGAPPAFPASMPFPHTFGGSPFGAGPAGMLPGMAASMPLHTPPVAGGISSPFLPYDAAAMAGMSAPQFDMAASAAKHSDMQMAAMAFGGPPLMPPPAMPVYPPSSQQLLSPEEYALHYRRHMEQSMGSLGWGALHGAEGPGPRGPGMHAGAGYPAALPVSSPFHGGMAHPMMMPPPHWDMGATAAVPGVVHPAAMGVEGRMSAAGGPPYGGRGPKKGAYHEHHARKGPHGGYASERDDAEYHHHHPHGGRFKGASANGGPPQFGHHHAYERHGSKSKKSREEAAHHGGQPQTLLEEFKASKPNRFEFKDILGHVQEFSLDQHGSRFIQQKLEVVDMPTLRSALAEVLPNATALITDVFGNYVMQKFLEHGNHEVRERIAAVLKGQVLSLSLQMYGCRVMQKALEVLDVDTQCSLIAELDGNIMRCVRDQNGNHVIQKIIECVPTERITGLIDNFLTCVVPLSTHPFGCRVIQRVLEHCSDAGRKVIVMAEILRETCLLTKDQYGNYVIQHVLQHGQEAEREQIIHTLAPFVVSMSMHKFASNVIEKCLAFGTTQDRDLMVNYMLTYQEPNTDDDGTSEGSKLGTRPSVASTGSASGDEEARKAVVEEPLQVMMKDQYGNYVVQKVLEVCDDTQREQLLQRVRAQLCTLKKYTYGKHIVARMEKLLSAGAKIQSHLRARPLPDDLLPLNVRVSSPPIAPSHSSPAVAPNHQQPPQQCGQRDQASADSAHSSTVVNTPGGAAAADSMQMPLSAPSYSSPAAPAAVTECGAADGGSFKQAGSSNNETAFRDTQVSRLANQSPASDASQVTLSRADESSAAPAQRPQQTAAGKGADCGLPLTDSSSLNMMVTK